MLRVTRTESNGTCLVKVEGTLREPWLDEVRRACESDQGARRIALDLSAVTFVDRAGQILLRELLERGASIAACSGFVAELLHVGRP